MSLPKVGFLGLGAMGIGMSQALLRDGFQVFGYDPFANMDSFIAAGGQKMASVKEAVAEAEVVVIMVTNANQVESVLTGEARGVDALQPGTIIIVCSTTPPKFISGLAAELSALGFTLLDAPVSGGTVKANHGTLTVMASGPREAYLKATPVLESFSHPPPPQQGGGKDRPPPPPPPPASASAASQQEHGNLYYLGAEPGSASTVKMVNQLLAGVHIAAAAEAMALGVRAGVEADTLFQIISQAAGNSWMFSNRVPVMLEGIYPPLSCLDIFVKDLGIVLGEGAALAFPTPLAALAHQLFIQGSASGLGRLHDASVVQVYERSLPPHSLRVSGGGGTPQASSPQGEHDESARSPSRHARLSLSATLASLPAEVDAAGLQASLDAVRHSIRTGAAPKLVVLDDDPTGTQTCHGINVVTEWSVDTLRSQLESDLPGFFVLTNSRALDGEAASALIQQVCRNLLAASEAAGGVKFSVTLRGDSTMRGHFPQEPRAAEAVLGQARAWLICPFFLQGGRYTIDDVHYVADGDTLVPCGETEFSKDPVFGYESSDLKQYVQEKTAGDILAKDVISLPISVIRSGSEAVVSFLSSLPSREGVQCVVVANAAAASDLTVLAGAALQAELGGNKLIYRTAASFVSSRLGIQPIPPLTPQDLILDSAGESGTGGLIVVGSFVPKTTAQVNALVEGSRGKLLKIEMSVESLVADREEGGPAYTSMVQRITEQVNACLGVGRDVLVVTSRGLVTGASTTDTLRISQRVSSALVEVVQNVQVRPRFIIAKGGITSSDTATRGLGVKQAKIIGQAAPGVPMWELGPESRQPGVPYVVFPGNVGGVDTLLEVWRTWSLNWAPGISLPLPSARPTTQEMLRIATRDGYAVGGFNVYDLEGMLAVVEAAERTRSPAIIQILPVSLRRCGGAGGAALVAAAQAAISQSAVPITLHLDHAPDKQDIEKALDLRFDSVLADFSHLVFQDNLASTREVAVRAHALGVQVEAEIGRLAGYEPGGPEVGDLEAHLTDPDKAHHFVQQTKVDMLAVCVGNRHGHYPPSGPSLDLTRLEAIRSKVDPACLLVLHGVSGLPSEQVQACIKLGVCKLNVNTEVREAYLKSMEMNPAGKRRDVLQRMEDGQSAMTQVISEKMKMFGSAGQV